MPQRSRQQSLPGVGPDDGPSSPPEPPPDPTAEKPTGRAADPPLNPKAPAAQPPPVESLEGWDVYVVDAHSLIFQVFHALPEMTSSQGEQVGAVYGFTRDILYLLEEKRPDCLLCAFDLPGPTFRHEIYKEYKADRGEMPEELAPQFPKIRRILEALGVPVLESEGYEADDVLATVARKCDQLGGRCLLVSGDKDCRQLITDRVSVYNLRKDEIYDAESLADDWGVRPDQVVDFQALMGDSVDNVPGVALIGPKIARELLETYNTLDAVLDHASEVKGAKRRQNLIEGREVALMSRELVRLSANVPIELDWNAGRPGRFNQSAITELFAEYRFRSLYEKAARLGSAPVRTDWTADYQIVDTREKLADFVSQLAGQRLISIDTETTSVWPRWAEIVGYSFAWKPGEAYYLPVRAPEGEVCLDPKLVADSLRPILEDPAIGKIGQNLKYDMIVLRTAGIRLAGIVFDTMIASYLLDAGERNHNLDELSERYLNHTTTKITALIGSGKNQKRMDEVPVADVGPYAAEDADVPLRLYPLLAARLEESELTRLNAEVETPLVAVLAEMEYDGICVDVERLSELSRRFRARTETLEAEIHELAGHPFNIASPKQLGQVLFEELHLPVVKKTKSGPSTDADVLQQLADEHPLPAKIIEYRQYAKLSSTYVDALPGMVHPTSGRVHASFNQVVAATGRLSSSDPNLQNIPVRTEAGREIRSAFVPGEAGWKLLAADYSQIELRILAHFSGDETLSQSFANDEDIHARVASEVYGVPLADVTPEMRRGAKAVNFGVIYGQSPFGLAKALNIEQDEAAEFIDAYFGRYPGVEKFLTKTLEACRDNGYVKTILGRRRAIRGVRADAGRQRNLPERTAINTVVQGSAADLIKMAMLSIHTFLRREKFAARMLVQIHDELIFEVPSEELDDLGILVTKEMTGVLTLDVPLKVDLKSGDNWADCEPWS